MPNQFLSDEFGDIEDYFVTDYWLIDQFVGDTLWVWSTNFQGQLGTNDTTNKLTPVTTFAGGNNWKQVSANGHTAAIKTDGTLWMWGPPSLGKLGTNDTTPTRSTPVTTFVGGTNWKQVSCGGNHTAAIKTDGTLWTWGWNQYGDLGINNTAQRSIPVTTFAGGNNWKQVSAGQSGNGHTAAIKTDGSLWVWGYNAEGQLGINITNSRNSIPVTTFAGGNNWKQVSCGLDYTAAVKTDGSLWTWGGNNSGQLGTNDTARRTTPVTTFAGGTTWKSVFAGGGITAAIKTDGSLWTWGGNGSGELGNNTTITSSTPVTTFAGGNNWKQVSIGYVMTAIKTDGTLWSWGNATNGALGNNLFTVNRSIPVTTFAGGNNWKSVGKSGLAIKSGLNVDLS